MRQKSESGRRQAGKRSVVLRGAKKKARERAHRGPPAGLNRSRLEPKWLLSLSLSSSAGHRRHAKPPGHMGPPFGMGLLAGREKSSISPDTLSLSLALSLSLSLSLALSLSLSRSLARSLSLSLALSLFALLWGMDRKQSLRPAHLRNPIQHFVWMGSDFTWTESAVNEKAGARCVCKNVL